MSDENKKDARRMFWKRDHQTHKWGKRLSKSTQRLKMMLHRKTIRSTSR